MRIVVGLVFIAQLELLSCGNSDDRIKQAHLTMALKSTTKKGRKIACEEFKPRLPQDRPRYCFFLSFDILLDKSRSEKENKDQCHFSA